MKSKNEINNGSDEDDKIQKPPENILNRLDSPTMNDNETNSILEKEETNNNNIIELDKPININKEIQKKNFLHDKDITEDSIIYFSNKLKQSNRSYKLFLYISIIIYILDIIIWFKSKNILHNYFNLFSIIIILLYVVYQAYIFRHNFETITKEMYDLTQTIIYIYISIAFLFLINILYIIYFYMHNKKKFFRIKKNFYDSYLVLYVFVGTNFFVCVIFMFNLFILKNSIKNLSAAKGDIYDSPSYEEVQIINSVINEI